jgi:hypothetical protein
MRDHDDDAFELIDGKRVLRDGKSMRVSLFDASVSRQQRDVARGAADVRLHDGNGRPVGRRPGFVINDDVLAGTREARDAAYREADESARSAFKNLTGFGSTGFVGGQEGSVCTVRGLEFPDDQGSPGHMRMHAGQLCCVPDGHREDALPTNHSRAAAYAAYDAEISDRWRRNKQ